MKYIEDRSARIKEIFNKEYKILVRGDLEISCSPYAVTWAVLLFALGILMPYLISERSVGVIRLLKSAYSNDNAGPLLESAIMLNILNTIRTVPIYFCAMFLSDAFRVTRNQKRDNILSSLLFLLISLVTIWASYSLILSIYDLRYGFGMHSLLIMLFVIIIDSQEIRRIKPRIAVLVMSLFVFGVQFLEIVPALSPFGLGKGELSTYVKNAALLLGTDRVLTIISVTVFLVSTITSFIIVRLVVDDYRLREEMQKKDILEKRLYATRMEAVEMRTFREIQNLVHDLKAPLTTIEGLASLTRLMSEDPKVIEYQERICSSSEKMSHMISEILYEDKKGYVETDTLMKMALTNIDGLKNFNCIEYTNSCKRSLIFVNQIRMSRAIVNIIQNALAAISDDGRIKISVNRKANMIEIKVVDDGKGIPPEDLSRIWEMGYSKNQSAGIGLSFVKSVINNHEGQIGIESELGKYTSVTVLLKGKKDGRSKHPDN